MSKSRRAWIAYLLVGVLCTVYLDYRAEIVPAWGKWYMASRPHVLLQVRAFLSGTLAIFPHSVGSGHDYAWGRGGMHQMRGLGVAILALPFHLLARAFGQIGFPDNVRFLIFYFLSAVWLTRALFLVTRRTPQALAGSCLGAAFVLLFPTLLGMISARFLIFEHTIAVGALWCIVLFACTLRVLESPSERALIALCALAGFAAVIRQPLAVYGLSTLGCALGIGWQRGLARRARWLGLGAFALVTLTHLWLTRLRFGDPWVTGYETSLSGPFVNRSTRWGLEISRAPLWTGLRELFVTFFRLTPRSQPLVMSVPDELRAYGGIERWREYYSPTFDLLVLALVVLGLFSVAWQALRQRAWRRDFPVAERAAFVMGAWAVLPTLGLLLFYARFDSMVTRYAVDLVPAACALLLSLALFTLERVRERAPAVEQAAALVLAGGAGLYLAGSPGWPVHLSPPIDVALVQTTLAEIDSTSRPARGVLSHFTCGAPRGPQAVYMQLAEWQADCTFKSGMVVAMPYSPCISLELGPAQSDWSEADRVALAALRVNGDFDHLNACPAPRADGRARRVTYCAPRAPRFLLDDLRLYTIASLDERLRPLDRLKLLQIDAAPACP